MGKIIIETTKEIGRIKTSITTDCYLPELVAAAVNLSKKALQLIFEQQDIGIMEVMAFGELILEQTEEQESNALNDVLSQLKGGM